MKAVRVHHVGGLDAMTYEETPRPAPGAGQVLVHVRAAGVGPWDALVRSGESKLKQPLPLILGSDISGVVESVGPGVTAFAAGEEVYGATNPMFTGGYAEYAVVEAGMIASKPKRLSHIEAASAPVIACTAWQMVFDYGKVDGSKRVLVHGAAGNVGALVTRLAKQAGAEVIGTGFPNEQDAIRAAGADLAIDITASRFEERFQDIDIVLDTVGGETQDRSFVVVKRGGIIVSSVSPPDPTKLEEHDLRGVFFYVAVTTERLILLAEQFERGRLKPLVGEVLPLSEARLAHEMLAGKSHKPGKIVLAVFDEN